MLQRGTMWVTTPRRNSFEQVFDTTQPFAHSAAGVHRQRKDPAMDYRHTMQLLPIAAALSSCNGTPASVADASEKLRAEFGKDGYEVTWLNVVEKNEPGTFGAIIDRISGGDPQTEETLICSVSATSNSSSWTCQTASPSIMIQAAEMLKKDYESRKITVLEYNLRRTGTGNEFAGYFVLAGPPGKETLRIPCKGNQDGTDFTIDCDQSFGEDTTKTGVGKPPGNVT